MPNYVKNYLRIDFGDSSSAFKENFWEAMKGKSPDKDGKTKIFSLQSFLPMPECMNLEEGSMREYAVWAALSKINGARNYLGTYAITANEEYKDRCESYYNGLSDEEKSNLIDMGCKYLRNYALYGCWDWYSWALKNWGTKWDVWDAEITALDKDGIPDEIVFYTAWSAPLPALQKLSEKFPELTIDLRYADEDIGSNCGYCSWHDGEECCDIPDDPVAFANDIWGPDISEDWE